MSGQGMSTAEIFERARELLALAERLMGVRRGRERATEAVTDLWVVVEQLGRRVGDLEFYEGPVAVEEEEGREDHEPMTLALADLFPVEADAAEMSAAEDEGLSVEELRLRYFRQFLDYHAVGCRTVEDVTKRVIAFARRVRPESLREFGLSQADVGRRLGESRAVVNAREKRTVEEPLKRIGARGFHGLGGVRSEQHRERCREAQRGNSNRRRGEERKRREAQ